MIDGKSVDSLDYDSNEITAELFAQAESKKQNASNASANRSGAMELDYSLHLYLGLAAIVAVNPSYTFEDVARIKGHDTIEVMYVGRNFIMTSEDSPGEDSDVQFETLPESTIPA
jgi:hypothetical protein